jgi:hypothetical protein
MSRVQQQKKLNNQKQNSNNSSGGIMAQRVQNSTLMQRKEKRQEGIRSKLIQRKENKTGLPTQLKDGIESLSGYDMSDVKVHRNSSKPATLNAHAYAQGTDIHLGSGQEKHLPHEAWHVVQQKQGRVKATTQAKSKTPINDDVGLEREADVMGAKAMQMKAIDPRLKGKGIPEAMGGDVTNTKDSRPVATLSIHSDIDTTDFGISDLRNGQVGHSWVSLIWDNQNTISSSIATKYPKHYKYLSKGSSPFGFWPRMFELYNEATDTWINLPPDERTGYSTNPFSSYVKGQVVHPDTIHTPKATQEYKITEKEAINVMNYAESKKNADYSVYYFNCTTFAADAVKSAGKTPPSSTTLGVAYPNKLYDSIKKNQKNKTTGSN